MLSTQDFTARLTELAALCEQVLDLIEAAHERFCEIVDPDAEARDPGDEQPSSDAWPAVVHAFEQRLSDSQQSIWEAKNVALNLVDAPPDHTAWRPYEERVRLVVACLRQRRLADTALSADEHKAPALTHHRVQMLPE